MRLFQSLHSKKSNKVSKFDFSILNSGNSMMSYIDAASEKKNDSQEDRIIDVFYHLRQTITKKDWYRIPGIRDFFSKYSDSCPYIPNDIKEAEVLSRLSKKSPKEFLENWIIKYGPIQEFAIDPQSLLETIEKLPKVKNTFLKQNLHDINYFFSKYTEWHISRIYQKKINAKKIVDIGAAYDGFSQTLIAFDDDIRVTMVDLNFPKGLKMATSQIYKFGTDAANMDLLETSSIDLVCMHNAFEHFDGDSDIGCLKEVSRILRPGGIALITPFFFSQKYSITVNPIASFLFESSDYFKRIIRDELHQNKARIDFNNKIVSPFARRYDLTTTNSRIMKSTPELDIRLRKCIFKTSPILKKYYLKENPHLVIDPQLYERSYFNFLELTKK